MLNELNTELLRAIKRSDVTKVTRLLRAGASTSCEDVQGWTPLDHAANTGNLEMLRLLVEAGADVNSHRATGATPLFTAVLSRHLDAVKLLLNAGALPDAGPYGAPIANHIPRDWKRADEAIALLGAAVPKSSR